MYPLTKQDFIDEEKCTRPHREIRCCAAHGLNSRIEKNGRSLCDPE